MTTETRSSKQGGFTLMETVIAIGVLAVLLTAFLAVFTPAAQGIRKAISVQEADRLAYALETELVTLRNGAGSDYSTGFDKAFEWILSSSEGGTSDNTLIIYQYRGEPDSSRSDGTLEPFTGSGAAGEDFIVQPMVRRRGDPFLANDLAALEGRIFTARLTQLVMDNEEMKKGTAGQINDPTPGDGDAGGPFNDAEEYPEAVIPFVAEFYQVPNTAVDYVQNRLDLDDLGTPMFTRNLAVRR